MAMEVPPAWVVSVFLFQNFDSILFFLDFWQLTFDIEKKMKQVTSQQP